MDASVSSSSFNLEIKNWFRGGDVSSSYRNSASYTTQSAVDSMNVFYSSYTPSET